MKKFKKPLIIAALVLDVGVTIFLFVISIIILSKVIPAATIEEAKNSTRNMPLIHFLLEHNMVYFIGFVLPLFVLLVLNIVGLIIYVKKTNGNQPAQLEDLTEEQKEALRQELLKDLGNKDNN